MKDRYSVAEYAKEIGKSRQAVNSWVKQGLFDGFTETVDGVLYISADALQKFGNDRPVKDIVDSQVNCQDDSKLTSKGENDNNLTSLDNNITTNTPTDTPSKEESKEVKQKPVDGKEDSVYGKEDGKDALIKFLQIQLAERDAQIAEYKSQIADYTDRFAELAKTGHEIADRALRTTEQAHLIQLQATLPEPEVAAEEPPKKRGLFGRFRK